MLWRGDGFFASSVLFCFVLFLLLFCFCLFLNVFKRFFVYVYVTVFFCLEIKKESLSPSWASQCLWYVAKNVEQLVTSVYLVLVYHGFCGWWIFEWHQKLLEGMHAIRIASFLGPKFCLLFRDPQSRGGFYRWLLRGHWWLIAHRRQRTWVLMVSATGTWRQTTEVMMVHAEVHDTLLLVSSSFMSTPLNNPGATRKPSSKNLSRSALQKPFTRDFLCDRPSLPMADPSYLGLGAARTRSTTRRPSRQEAETYFFGMFWCFCSFTTPMVFTGTF